MTNRQSEALSYMNAVRDAEGAWPGSRRLGTLMGISAQAAARLIDRLRLAGHLTGLGEPVARRIAAECRAALVPGATCHDVARRLYVILELLGETP